MSELAWAAGLFEGEGCFYLRRATGKRSVHLGACLAMADEEIVRRFSEVVGVGVVAKNQRRLQRPHHSVTWRWQANGPAVSIVYELLGPWLGTRRRTRYAEILDARLAYEADRDSRAHSFPRFSSSQQRVPA